MYSQRLAGKPRLRRAYGNVLGQRSWVAASRTFIDKLPKPKIDIMLPRTTSIWQADSQPLASGKPAAVQHVQQPVRLLNPDWRPIVAQCVAAAPVS
jgi:hypothetical protein